MPTQSTQTLPPSQRSEGVGRSPGEVIRDMLVLACLMAPAYFVSVVLFVIGFVIIPSSGSDPSVHVRFGNYATFTDATTRVQGLVFIVLLGSVLVGTTMRFLGARLSTAILIVFTLDGIYWGLLLAIYIAGILAGVFVLPFR
jgi:hypothetical protein